ncbi:MAG: hypothetical protein QOF48_4008 [Verrucomicrobiota bacterium]
MLLDACGKVPSNGVAATSNSVSAPVKGDVASTPPPVPPAGTNAPSMEANQSVVVVKDLGFGKKPPVLEEVLRDLERRSQADDGRGRTFAILEAFTQTDVVSGNLNLCLRLSTEKPGIGEIVYRRTGQSLWKNRVTPATHKSGFTGGSLTILFDTGDGKSFTVDGSMNPPSILDAILKEPGVPVAQAWPEGEVRDVAFIYSACGCPIHVKCRRSGDRTLRVEKATQLIFPDDPAAVEVISRLMRW